MAGTWPLLDLSDLETRSRTLLNEPVAAFFTQAELWRWLSLWAGQIGQKAGCVRRILDAATVSGSREVAVNALKTHHVEYIPASGRPVMLRKITPLQVGNYETSGLEPQHWYEFGAGIAIDPEPAATHDLRLYVSDVPKIRHATWPIGDFSTGWTEKAGHAFWSADATDLTFAGTALNDENDMEGPALTASTNYTVRFTVSGLADAQVIPKAGTTAGPAITANGLHTATLVSSAGSPKLTFTGKDLKTGGGGTFNIDDVYLLKEADFAAVGDQTELSPAWYNILIFYALMCGLTKARKSGPARMLEGICEGGIEYLRHHVVETLPEGKNALNKR